MLRRPAAHAALAAGVLLSIATTPDQTVERVEPTSVFVFDTKKVDGGVLAEGAPILVRVTTRARNAGIDIDGRGTLSLAFEYAGWLAPGPATVSILSGTEGSCAGGARLDSASVPAGDYPWPDELHTEVELGASTLLLVDMSGEAVYEGRLVFEMEAELLTGDGVLQLEAEVLPLDCRVEPSDDTASGPDTADSG